MINTEAAKVIIDGLDGLAHDHKMFALVGVAMLALIILCWWSSKR